LAPRVVSPADPSAAQAILRAALADGATAVVAVAGEWLVGIALATTAPVEGADQLVALGVAPERRRGGLAGALLRALVEEEDRQGSGLLAVHTAAERDPFDPLPREVRRGVADRLLRAAGFRPVAVPDAVSAADPDAGAAVHLPPSSPSGLLGRIEDWLAER
jgi:GNAT superfamily N-acetyltransferase